MRSPFCDTTLSLTACPSCFGPVFQGMRFCPACGAPVRRAELGDPAEKPKSCPRCDIGMAPAEVGGVRIDECSRCGGLWLDVGTFEALHVIVDEAASD